MRTSRFQIRLVLYVLSSLHFIPLSIRRIFNLHSSGSGYVCWIVDAAMHFIVIQTEQFFVL